MSKKDSELLASFIIVSALIAGYFVVELTLRGF